HRSNRATQPNVVTWADLDTGVTLIESALQQLGLVSARPDLQFFFERTSDLYNERLGQIHPTNPDVMMTQHFKFGVRQGDVRVLELTESFDYLRIGAG
ncbi:MAG: hypothetical protein JO257_07465, partial [Deltaproteobacteria bacterium]|nr:hypothetical protein [Deltaproteobacteria bacterium]